MLMQTADEAITMIETALAEPPESTPPATTPQA